MTQTTLRPYDPTSGDFLRIRQFLIDTFALYGRPFNWLIDRWNFCRYFVLPIHTCFNLRYFGVPTLTHPPFRDEAPGWEATIGVWEDTAGQIVGVVNSDNEAAGEAWLQVHPAHFALYDGMVAYAEARLADRVGHDAFCKIFVNENTPLEDVARARGYRPLDERHSYLEYRLGEAPPAPVLPAGFTLKSVAEEDDPLARAIAKTRAFHGHGGPSDWGDPQAWKTMQQAPDYHADLDLFIVAPNGDYASFCTIWVDEANHYANFEPVGTHCDYQGLGLGRMILQEGFRRMAQRGVTRSFMESDNEFYRKVGFEPTSYAFRPWIKYYKV